ncbi:hypothetical protein KAH37_06460, partial [bacterium]|nr:hypothetical protein [bacterium]
VIDSLEKKVLKIKDITAVSIVTYRGTVAKLTIEGSGPAAIKNLIAAFPKFKTVPLQITYQSGMETHLQYDIGRHLNTESAFFLRLSSIKTDKSSLAMLKESGPALCSAALSNLDFIHGSSVSMTTKSNKELLKSLNSQKTPLLVVTTIGKNGNTWQNSVEILHVKSKKKIVTTTATGKNPLEALTRSVAKLDTAFRKVLTKKWAQKLLSVDKNSAKMVNTPHIEIPTFSIEPIYPVLLPLYRKNGVGTLTLKNSGKESLKNIEIQFSIDKRVISTEKIAELKPGKTSSVTIKPNLLPPNHSARWYGQLKAAILYAVGDSHAAKDGYAPLLIHEKNAMNWETPDMLAAFIDSSNSSVRESATRGVKNAKSPLLLTSQLERASALYEALWHSPLRYVKDPVNTSFSSAIDTVQYPWETMTRQAGDCDDLTVLLASLYESIGLSTIVITTPGHVLLAVESGVLAGGNLLFALPETLFIEKDGALFIPVEATAIVKNFGVAWQKGASILQSAKSVNVFRTREAWKKFVPFSPSSKPATMSYNTPTSRKEMLNMLRKSDKSSVPAWYKSIYDALVHKKPVQPKIALKKASPIALANVMLFTGKFEEGVISLANQCGKGSAASCYNLAVATLFTQSAAKSSSAKTIKDGALIDAVSMLPLSVRQMLLDGGGMGMGDEATTTSDTQKKLAEALKRAAQRIAKAKKSPGFAGKIKTSSVGGRKGAKAPKSINDIAPLLFWKEVSNGSKR